LECLGQVPNVFGCWYALYQYVVYVDFYVPPYLLPKHLVNQRLICSPNVLLSEWNDFVAIKPLISDEGYNLLVQFVLKCLVIPQT